MVFRSPNPPQRTKGSRSAPLPQLDEAFTIFNLRSTPVFSISYRSTMGLVTTPRFTTYEMLTSTPKAPNLLKTSESSGRSIIARVLSSFVFFYCLYIPKLHGRVLSTFFSLFARSSRHGVAQVTLETLVYWIRSLCFFVLHSQVSAPSTITHHPFSSRSYPHYICALRSTWYCWEDGKREPRRCHCGYGSVGEMEIGRFCTTGVCNTASHYFISEDDGFGLVGVLC